MESQTVNTNKAEVDEEKVYFLDREQKWPQKTGSDGYKLLEKLWQKREECLELAKKLMQQQNLDVEAMIAKGEQIYANKTSKKSYQTWSEEEYNDFGFRFFYLKLKSTQRFVEMYNLLQRAYNMRAIQIPSTKTKLRILSLGGGPGFELFAAKEFFKDYECELVSMDTQEEWKPFAVALGNSFIQMDFNHKDLIDMVKDKYDIILLSFVVGQHLQDYGILFKLVTSCNAIATIVNSGFERLNELYNLELKQIQVVRLLPGEDDRQAVLLKREVNVDYKADVEKNVLFPNVPYEEHKVNMDRKCSLGRKCENRRCKLIHPIVIPKLCKFKDRCKSLHCQYEHPKPYSRK